MEKIKDFIKKNKYLSIGILVFIFIIIIILIFALRNNTYAVNNSDYVTINCSEVVSPGDIVTCDVSANIVTIKAKVFQIDTEYNDLTYDSFVEDKDKGFDSVTGGESALVGFSLSNTVSGIHKIGTLKYKVPEDAKSGDVFTIKFHNIILEGRVNETDEETTKVTIDDIVKEIRIPSDTNTLNSITLSTGSLNETFNKDTNNYTANVGSDKVSIEVEKTDEYSTIEGNLKDINLHYGTNEINIKVISETKKENTYTIKVYRPYTLETEVYKYYKEDNKLYTKSDTTHQVIVSNLNISDLDSKIEDNKLIISYGEEELTKINLMNITSNKYTISNSKIYIGKDIDYSTFINTLVLNDVTVKIFNNEEEITTGTLTENHKLKVYYKEEVIDEYTFSEEYLNINVTVDETNKILTRLKVGTTVEELKKKIDTSGTITVKDNSTKKELSNTDIIKTGDTVEIKLQEKTEKYTISVLGDISKDGKIDNGDVGILYNKLKGKKELEKCQELAGDIISDGNIKINDVARLYRYFKGRVTELEVQ